MPNWQQVLEQVGQLDSTTYEEGQDLTLVLDGPLPDGAPQGFVRLDKDGLTTVYGAFMGSVPMAMTLKPSSGYVDQLLVRFTPPRLSIGRQVVRGLSTFLATYKVRDMLGTVFQNELGNAIFCSVAGLCAGQVASRGVNIGMDLALSRRLANDQRADLAPGRELAA